MDIVSRLTLLFSAWLATVVLVAWAMGPERKNKWFRKRDLSKSFLNRRGFMGEFLHLGYPCALEGWIIWIGFVTIIVATGYFFLFR